MFITVCAWCERESLLNILDCDPHGKDAISHGICPKHLEELKAEIFQADAMLPAGSNADQRQHSPAISI